MSESNGCGGRCGEDCCKNTGKECCGAKRGPVADNRIFNIFHSGSLIVGIFTMVGFFVALAMEHAHQIPWRWAIAVCISVFLMMVAEIWSLMRPKKKKEESPKPVPQFFVYYGNRSMVFDNDLLNSLTEEDVAHLSEAERTFFRLYKKDPFYFHSGFCESPRPSQEQECKFMIEMMKLTHQDEEGPGLETLPE